MGGTKCYKSRFSYNPIYLYFYESLVFFFKDCTSNMIKIYWTKINQAIWVTLCSCPLPQGGIVIVPAIEPDPGVVDSNCFPV